jgi:diguanylate cyclase (GGDEF)-like protein
VEVTRAARTQTPLAVAIADIDHFKAINDARGHLAGDAVLAAVSAAMRDLLRDCDLCGRFGGEEFALLLPRTAAAQALEITERIRQGISHLAIPRDGTAAIGSPSLSASASPARPAAPSMTSSPPPTTPSTRPNAAAATASSYTQTPEVRRPSRPLPLARTNILLG